MGIWLRCVPLLVLTIVAGKVDAQSEYIVLSNGDRISGTVKRIWDEELTIEPDYADEFAVDMAEIEYIVTDRDFEIELADGAEVTAALRRSDQGGAQLLVIEGETQVVELADIAELDEIDDYFDWESNVDASSVVNKGNTDSRTLRLSGNAGVTLGDHRHIADLTLAEESVEREKTKQQSLLAYNYNWLFGDQAYFVAAASYERDPIRNLDKRLIVGAGIGYDIWDDAGRSFTIQGGLGSKTEEIDNANEDNAIAFWGLRFSYDLLTDLQVYHDHSINSTLSGRDNTVTKTATGLRYEITDLLYLNFEVAYDYESNPAAGAENEDLAILAGFGFEF